MFGITKYKFARTSYANIYPIIIIITNNELKMKIYFVNLSFRQID